MINKNCGYGLYFIWLKGHFYEFIIYFNAHVFTLILINKTLTNNINSYVLIEFVY